MLKVLILLSIAVAVNCRVNDFYVDLGEDNLWDFDYGLSLFDERPTEPISLDNFKIWKKLGKGATAYVCLVQKKGGPDDGQFYALKASDIEEDKTNAWKTDVNVERDMLIAVRKLSWTTGLHYAWREGKLLFFAMDLGAGGSLRSKIEDNRPNATTARTILAELVVAIEQLHRAGILHRDIFTKNIVVGADGHILLSDLGRSKYRSDNDRNFTDWKSLSTACREILPQPYEDEEHIQFVNFLVNMSDEQLPELKKMPYFNGVDWERVAKKESDPPFDPIDIQVQGKPLHQADIFNTTFNDKTQTILADKYKDFLFIAPEYLK